MPARGTGVRAPPPTPRRAHSTCTSHEKSAPHPLLLDASDTTMAEPVAPRKTRPGSPTLDAANEVIRTLGLRGGEGDPPQEDAGTDSDLEEIPEPSTGSTPAEPAPPARSVSTLCPAWKRGHCTGEGWCPKQHPQPGPDNRALPEVGRAAARAALRYEVAQGWILDETARGSVNIQEAVDRVTHAGQAAVALHTRGRHGGPAEGIIVEPSGMVLVLAADMVPGVLHASRVRRARPEWTNQVYTPPRAWPFSTWAVLAVMWHLAPEDAPTGTAEEIARELHRPWGGLPVAPAAEGLSLAATLQRHPDKRARHFLQTGTVPAACQTPSGDGAQGGRNCWQAPGSSRCGICPWAPWPTPLKPSRGLSRSCSSPAWPCSTACRRGRPWYGGGKGAGARAPISFWSRARRYSTPRAWGPWNAGQSCPARRAGGSLRPPHSPCDRRWRANASYGWSPPWPPYTPLRGTYGGPY